MKKTLIIIAIIATALATISTAVFIYNVTQERKAIEQIQRTYAPTDEQIKDMNDEIEKAEYQEEKRLLDSIRAAELEKAMQDSIGITNQI